MKTLSIILSIAASAAVVATTVAAAPASSQIATPPHPDTIDVTVPLDAPATVADAITLAEESVGAPVSLKVEAPGMVGEYFLDSGRSPEDYTSWFASQWGTAPEVVAVVLEVPAQAAESTPETQEGEWLPSEPSVDVPSIIDTGKAPFDSGSPNGGVIREQLDALDSTSDTTSGVENETVTAEISTASVDHAATTVDLTSFSIETAAYNHGANWIPREMEIRVERVGSRTYISQYANWRGGTTPTARPQREFCGGRYGICRTVDYGMEFDVAFYNDVNENGKRPMCALGFEDNFLAANNSFNWGISVGQNSLASSSMGGGDVQGYADTFDWGDDCRKQSLAVGIKRPWLIPQNGRGYHSVLITIDSANGNATSNRVGGTVQLVDDGACQDWPGTSYTDCMGDYLYAPSGIQSYRLTLSDNRRWVAAPNKCWVSNGQGRDEPLLTQWNTRSGCYES